MSRHHTQFQCFWKSCHYVCTGQTLSDESSNPHLVSDIRHSYILVLERFTHMLFDITYPSREYIQYPEYILDHIDEVLALHNNHIANDYAVAFKKATEVVVEFRTTIPDDILHKFHITTIVVVRIVIHHSLTVLYSQRCSVQTTVTTDE